MIFNKYNKNKAIWISNLTQAIKLPKINLKVLIIPPKPCHKVSSRLETRNFREEKKICFPKKHQIKFFAC